ncbi:MAG TPA: hypothetical protein VHM25_23330 [Polyangiaceae bacterium]|nr:hypothetical protein [Polyangiaceae bacterium]
MLVGVHSNGTWVLMVSVLWVALGCGSSDDSPRTLSPSDVTNLPAGNAVGTTFSGVYVLDTATIARCDCRVGSCSMVRGSRGNRFTLTETDGALNVVLRSNSPDQIYNGGIDRNGQFLVGSTAVMDSYRSYSLLSGTVVAGASIDATSQNTFVGGVGGDDYDCDFTAELAISYVQPL